MLGCLRVKNAYNVLIMGASYGSLLGTKLALAGHNVTLVCVPAEVEAINARGVHLRMPVRGKSAPVEINSRNARGKIKAAPPDAVNVKDYDLVALALESAYTDPSVWTNIDPTYIPLYFAGCRRILKSILGRTGSIRGRVQH